MRNKIWFNPREPKPKLCRRCGYRLLGKFARRIKCPKCGSFLLIRDRSILQ